MNSIRSVLLHLDATPSSAARLEFARRFALRHQATLSAMFVAWPPQRPVQPEFTESPAALLQSEKWAAVDRTKSLFDIALADGGPPMRWLESSAADMVEGFCRQALYADLLVLGQHDPFAASPGSVPSGLLESVLIATDKPALILPYSGNFEAAGRDVAIGWNATPQAARAVAAALPWLRSARRVHVLTAVDESAQQHTGELDIAQYLQFHGIMAALHRQSAFVADPGAVLLAFAREVRADLLVMGCYRHSRLHELMLGGAARTVLESMTLPVLMAH